MGEIEKEQVVVEEGKTEADTKVPLTNPEMVVEGDILAPEKTKVSTSSIEKVSITDYRENPNGQMELFFLLSKGDENYSNLVDLYDMIPKGFYGKAKRTDGKYLPALPREFTHRNTRYALTIKPARITKTVEGKVVEEKEFYPGLREELIEDSLRKLACDGAGVFLADEQGEEAGVVFSLYGLQKELKRMGHTFSIQEIKEGLMVCAQTILELRSKNGEDILVSPMFSTVGISDRESWKNQGKNSKAFVRFNPLVSRSIKNKTYRQFAYDTSMSFRFTLSRYLHKRMSLLFRQASRLETYTIMLSTLLEDSGGTLYSRISNNNREAQKAFGELQKKKVINLVETTNIYDTKRTNKIIDYKYVIHTHENFIRDMLRFNAKAKELSKLS